jgi:hypothetical protein
MKGGGKYIRVWVYSANADYLNSVENQSRTVNEALAMHSQLQSSNITLPMLDNGTPTDSGTVYTSTVSPRSMSATTTAALAIPQEAPKLTCDNGHLLNGVSGKCVGKMCNYAK